MQEAGPDFMGLVGTLSPAQGRYGEGQRRARGGDRTQAKVPYRPGLCQRPLRQSRQSQELELRSWSLALPWWPMGPLQSGHPTCRFVFLMPVCSLEDPPTAESPQPCHPEALLPAPHRPPCTVPRH